MFTFHTSGSTGTPKQIQITRERIFESTKQTFDFIDENREIRNCLLCLDPDFIGGAMVVFRALIMNLDLFIMEPTRDVIKELPPSFSTDLVSMVPLQYQGLTKAETKHFKTILIGGAPIGIESERNPHSNVFSTYGMTETVSHIALRRMNEVDFQVLSGMELDLDSDSCLKIKGPVTDQKWLQTNDIVELSSERSFRWIGRRDHIINSGGVKLNPEAIERKLHEQIHPTRFLISSLPDSRLSEKVVLIIENSLGHDLNFDTLEKYERPKMVVEGQKITMTSSGKVDRINTRKSLIASQK